MADATRPPPSWRSLLNPNGSLPRVTSSLSTPSARSKRDWVHAWLAPGCGGLWTTFGGLTFGYIRERTGNVLAAALLHGLPQALAAALLGL